MHYIVHTDGGSRGNPGPAAIGVTIATKAGESVWQHGEAIGVTTNNVAEYRAVTTAMEHLLTLSPAPTQVDFVLDSLLVVQQLSGRYKINNADLKILASQVWQVMKQLACPVRFSHVLRHKNADADALVNQALDAV